MENVILYPRMAGVKEAAKLYDVSPYYIRNLARTGKIRFVVAGHRWLINLDSLAKYLAAGDPPPAAQSQTVQGVRQVAR